MAVLNHQPIVDPIQPLVLKRGQRLTRFIQAVDQDHDRLSFQTHGLPAGVFAVPFLSSNRVVLFGYPIAAGRYQINVSVEDPYPSAFEMTVQPSISWQIRNILRRIWE